MIEFVQIRRLARLANGGTPTADDIYWGGSVLWATPVDLARVDGGTISTTSRTLTAAGVRTGSATIPARSVRLSTRAPIGYAAVTASPDTWTDPTPDTPQQVDGQNGLPRPPGSPSSVPASPPTVEASTRPATQPVSASPDTIASGPTCPNKACANYQSPLDGPQCPICFHYAPR